MSQLDVDKICRLCSEKKGRLRSLFEQRQEYPISLRQIIFDVSKLEVDPEDKMPQKVCKTCLTTLLKIHETIEHYRANDLKLRKQLGLTALIEIKQEEEEVDMELLENALKHDLEVGDICVKQEGMLEECLNLELHEQSEVADKMDETVVTNQDPADTEIEEVTVIEKEDDEWKPTEGDAKDKDLPLKKSGHRGKTKQMKDGKLKFGRLGKKVPKRPRLLDHKCYICKSESHGSPEALIAHLNSSHVDLLPYTCTECDMETIVIKTVQRLNMHKRQHLNPKSLKKSRLRGKTMQENDGKPKFGRRRKKDPNRPQLHDHKCYICKSESLGTSEALIAHLNSSHVDLLPYTCTECVMETVVIRTVQRLNMHKRQHLNPEKCPHCDKRYTNKNNVAFHVQMYHQNHCPSACEHCGEVYPTKASLLYHMKLHTIAASCEICGKVFKERQKLRLHIQRRHEKLKKHECNICKKKLGSLDSVRIHMKTYHSNQEFKCSYCPKTFTAELTHRTHEKKHLDNPDYVASRDWSEHYTIVEGEGDKPGLKMKKCNLCGLVCTAMGIHLSMVHFPTEYRCKICDTTFKRKQALDAHVAKHDNGKPYQCPICGREFSDRKNLIAHLRTKQHRDHPLAQSLDWLGLNAAKAKPRKPKEANVDAQQQAHIEEDFGMDDSL